MQIRPRVLVLLGLALVAVPRVAFADYDETERRLKAVGVDDELRARIHTAIDRAVAWLLDRQEPGGGWFDRFTSDTQGIHGDSRVAHTVLASLALRHAGTPKARAAAAKGVAWLFDRKSGLHDETVNYVYVAGLASMLLAADRSHEDAHAVIAKGLLSAQDGDTGWFGYYGEAEGYAHGSKSGDWVQLSTTQFAVLGLWGAARRGVPVPRPAWRRHLEGLCALQTSSGSWPYSAPRGPERTRGLSSAKGGGYSTGTFMGIANLCLCEQHLGDLASDPLLARRLLAAKTMGLAALHRDGAAVIQSLEDGSGTGGWSYAGGDWSYYGLYALEKAAIFANLERVGGVAWYERGARALVGYQEKDGGWALGSGRAAPTLPQRSDLFSTVWALLFLLRSSEVYRPTTPSPVDSPPATTPALPPPADPRTSGR